MTDLTEKHCSACEGGVEKMDSAEVKQMLPQLPEWKSNDAHDEIFREFKFKNFYRTMAFVNAIAWIANQEGHHPDLKVGYDYCYVRYSTHAIEGLSENDFICAAKVDALFEG